MPHVGAKTFFCRRAETDECVPPRRRGVARPACSAFGLCARVPAKRGRCPRGGTTELGGDTRSGRDAGRAVPW
jgi:hypothetical protein